MKTPSFACGNCRYYEDYSEINGDPIGICRRNPPVLADKDDPAGQVHVFMDVYKHSYCGEHQFDPRKAFK